jgi:hypothetical protein
VFGTEKETRKTPDTVPRRKVTPESEGLRREALQALRSDAAIHFLAQFVYEITRVVRTEYGSDGTMPPGSGFALRCFNEMLHRTSMQMRQVLGTPRAGYPDDVYLNILENEATVGERLEVLHSVMVRALRPGGASLP